MERIYTINDIAAMTGLTTRTLRSDIRLGFLKGEKQNGVWRFSQDEFTDFIAHPSVKPSLMAKRQGIVYDFLADTNKDRISACLILDDLNERQLKEIMIQVNSLQERDESLRFAMYMQEGHRRIVLSASPESCRAFLEAYR